MRWIQQANVRSQRVVDDSPGQRQQLIFVSNVLDQQQKRSVRLVDNEAAVEILQQVELAFQDVFRVVRVLLTVSVPELGFNHVGA